MMWNDLKLRLFKAWAHFVYRFVFRCPGLRKNLGAQLWATGLWIGTVDMASKRGELEYDRGQS
jgi:hypothetical protein